MSLIEIANRSIAFNPAMAEDLNRKAAALDPRIYCFAYYEPTPLPTEASPHAIFHVAVLNMYGLLWDCGPKIMEEILTKRLYREINRNTTSLDQCYEFYRIIQAIRTDLCHNNSKNYYFNALLKKIKEDYIATHGVVGGNDCSLTDWGKLCMDFFKRCNLIVQEIDGFIKSMTTKRNSKLINIWLEAICHHYESGDNFFMHVLADWYKLKLQMSNASRNITKTDVRNWVNSVSIDNPDFYTCYWEKCRKRIDPLLNGAHCPKPALPLDFFRSITKDASSF